MIFTIFVLRPTKCELKIEIGEKTCQNAENKQTFDFTGKIGIDEKTCQNAENKQTFGLTR